MGNKVTDHAQERAAKRGLPQASIEKVVAFDREVHTRGAVIFAVGHKEVEQATKAAEDISRLEGWHVVCSREGDVVTVYRNYNLRGLRPRKRTRSDRYLRSRIAA